MLQLRQLNLQLALMALRALGEDVQYQPGTVQNPRLNGALQVAFLSRG
jgi:hypothetical protein